MSPHGDPPLPLAALASADAADAAAAEAAYAAAEKAAAAAAAAAGAVSPSGSADDAAAELDKRFAAMDLGDPIPGLDRYFVPLRLACESKLPKIMEVALHCIQKIIAYGYVRGKLVQAEGAPKLMMEVVMVSNRTPAGASAWRCAPDAPSRLTVARAGLAQETICACKDEEDKDVQLQIVQAVNTAVTSSVASVHDTTLLLAVKTCFYIYLVSKNATIQKTANATLTQMLDVVFARLESPAATSMAQKDAFLVFRSLCKLSMKPLPDPLPSDDSIELRSKLLSLQLLYAIILKSGSGFRSGEKFIWAIRQYLCLSLLKNGVSTIPSILQLSLDIFVTLIKFFKEHLKSEIGVFFSNILLRILESSNSSGQQKQLTIQALKALVAEPQLMVDLFLNYDCDLEGKGIFTSMCDGLSRLTLSIQALSETTEQDAILKQLALETLVLIADSMVQWEREVGREPHGVAATPPALAEDSAKPEGGGEAGAAEGGADVVSDGSDGRVLVVAAPAASGGAVGTALGSPLEAVDFEAMYHRKHEVQEGVIKFNMKPKRGIKYLMDVCGLEDTPAAVARFLRSTEGLDKRAVGEYLGEGEDFSKQVLYAYVDSIDFADSTFDAALRKFLSLFWLPGEAQKIDRMMEKFAERYCSQNEGVFANADTAYVLAYSLIMLNTDAHSSQARACPTPPPISGWASLKPA
jgi:brefeldin A-inhibited guanine nucleotide-exchange protein